MQVPDRGRRARPSLDAVGLGILGGTFNPPHLAHLVCASEARWQLGLERVLLVPTGVPPHKEMDDEPGRRAPRSRCAGCAVAGARDWLEVSALEVDARRPVVHGRYA